MSYEIVYDKCFIKAKRNEEVVFVPMIYAGPNNCIQFDRSNRGRRERSWGVMTYILNGKVAGTLEEMLKKAESEKEAKMKDNPDYSDKSFGSRFGLSFGGRYNSTFGQYKGLFITGCKKALTVEELKKFGVSVIIGTYLYDDKKKEALKQAGMSLEYEEIETSDELLEKFEAKQKYFEGTGVSVFLILDASEHQMQRIRRALFPKTKKTKQFIDVEKYFAIYVAARGYFHSSTRRGFRYTPYKNAGMCFVTEKEAEKRLKKFKERYPSQTAIVEVINESNRIVVLV